MALYKCVYYYYYYRDGAWEADWCWPMDGSQGRTNPFADMRDDNMVMRPLFFDHLLVVFIGDSCTAWTLGKATPYKSQNELELQINRDEVHTADHRTSPHRTRAGFKMKQLNRAYDRMT